MLTTIITKAAVPTLVWAGSEPGLLAILRQAIRTPSRKPRNRRAVTQPVPFAWL